MTDSSRWLRRASGAVLAAGVLAGCSTSTSGRPAGLTSADTPTTPGTSTSTGVPTGFPTDVPSLAATVNKAMVSATSAHVVLTFDETAGPIKVRLSGEGDETIENGKSTGLQMIINVSGSGTERLVQADGKSYVMLPPNERTSNKPWSLVTLKSSNKYVRNLAEAMQATPSFTGIDSAKIFLAASDRLDQEGATQLSDGTQVVRYALDVLTARLPNSSPAKRLFTLVGLKNVPTDLAIDATGHIRQLRQRISITLNGIKVKTDTQTELSDYDAPVDISPPPPDQVSRRS